MAVIGCVRCVACVGLVWCVGLAGAVLAQDWPAVIQQLRHNSAGKRIDALNQLHAGAQASAAEFVAPLVTDPEDAVQFAAIDAELSFFLTESIGPRGSRSRAQEAFDRGPFARTPAPAPPVLIDHLISATADRNPRIRFDALHALGVIAVPPLINEDAARLAGGLTQGDDVMRMATARVLGRLRATGAGDALIAALNDSNEMVQLYATEALGLMRYERAVQALADRATFFRRGPMADETLMALARIGHASSRDLLRADLTHAEAPRRRAAAEGAGRIGDRASLDAVRILATADKASEVRLAGLFALDRLGEPQSVTIAASIAVPGLEPQARDYLLEIGQGAAPAARDAIVKATNTDVIVQLINVLGFIGDEADARWLEPYLKTPQPLIARAAAYAVGRIRK
jgi:HEAT repeat protein